MVRSLLFVSADHTAASPCPKTRQCPHSGHQYLSFHTRQRPFYRVMRTLGLGIALACRYLRKRAHNAMAWRAERDRQVDTRCQSFCGGVTMPRLRSGFFLLLGSVSVVLLTASQTLAQEASQINT